MIDPSLIIVECDCLTATMKNQRGPRCHLPLTIARKMEQEGHVRIITDGQGKIASSSGNNASIDQNIIQILSDTDYLSRKSFDKSQHLTKVAWIQDYHKDGGAELSSQVVVRIGAMCGFDIVGITPDNFNMDLIKESEIAIINNCFEFSNDQFNQILGVLFNGKKYVKYEHDHREINLRSGIGKRLFENSKMNIFISPQHRKNHEVAFGDCIKNKSIALPLAIRTTRFIPVSGVDRKENSYIIPSYRKCKENVDTFIKEHPEYSYTVCGEMDNCQLPNVKNLGAILITDMAKLYSEHQYMLHLPLKPGGGERVVFESILCGCEPLTNENALHTSWSEEWDYRDPKVLRSKLDVAPHQFWREVNRIVQE